MSRSWHVRCASLLLLPVLAANAAQPLLVSNDDQRPTKLLAAELPPGPHERAPVAFAWALDPHRGLHPAPPTQAVSRGFGLQVDAAQLQAGVVLPFTARGAVLHLSPGPGAAALPAERVQLLDRGGRNRVAVSADTAQLRQTGMAAAEGSSMLRIAADAAPGSYRLHAEQAKGRYNVQVIEPDSPWQLHLQLTRTRGRTQDERVLQVRLLGPDGSASPHVHRGHLAGEALLVAPDGRSWPVPLAATEEGQLQARVSLAHARGDEQGLWELQVFTQTDGLLRDGKIAFAAARPTARLTGTVLPDRASRRIALPVEVGAVGRYALHGTLYATAADGRLRPVAQAQAAAWFASPGAGVLTLPFNQVRLPAGFGPPYEVRELQLHDQSRLGVIERRLQAVRY